MDTCQRRKMVAEMSKAIFQYCLSRTSSYQESEDLSQEILLTLCQSIENLHDEKAFYAFVWRTADNILKGWYRCKDRHSTDELDENLPDDQWKHIAEMAEENERLLLITRELALLGSNYRRATVAYYIDGLSVRDISARFSLSQSMVKYLLFQSRKRIKEGITMGRNFGEYSYNPVHLDWRWLAAPVMDYKNCHSSIQQNILMVCYYEKQNEEQIALQLGVPTAYLEDEIKNLLDCELLTQKNGFYLTNVLIQTKRAMDERFQAKEKMLKQTAEMIKTFFAENEERIRDIGFYGSDMPVNSLKWFVMENLLRVAYAGKLDDELSRDFPDAKSCPYARIVLIEQEEAPKGNNYDPLWNVKRTENGHILFHWVRFNSPVFHQISDVQASVLVRLPNGQPETDNDKMICTELIDMGFAVRSDGDIKPNLPCFTKEQDEALWSILEPLAQQLYLSALDRAELTKKLFGEHTPDRFQPYANKMIISPMEEEVSDITRILVEDGWAVRWSGMNPTNIIFLK